VLAALMALSAGLIWAWSGQETLLGDEWGYAFRTATEPAGQYLLNPPPGKHLIAVPLLLYKLAFDGLGIHSYAPYRIAHIVLLLLCAGLFFLLARRRLGDTLALLPTAILLFLGSSWEVLAESFRSPSLVAIAAGLAMLLALERRDLRGDAAACVALALSLASHSTSFAFAAAAAVLVLSRPAPERWRRCWVFVLPIIAYAIWWSVDFETPAGPSLISRIADLPVFLGKSLGVTLLSTAGLITHSQYGGIHIPRAIEVLLGAALVALLAVLLIVRARRRQPISPFALAMAAALLVFWISTGLAPGPERIANSSRYMYPDALLFLLLLCELGRDFELPRRLSPQVAVAILALFAVSIAGNVYDLSFQERVLNNASDRFRGGLASLAVESGQVSPNFSIFQTLAGRFPASDQVAQLNAAALAAVFADYGSPAYNLTELASRPDSVRATADLVALEASGAQLRPVAKLPAAREPAPHGLTALGGSWQHASHGCIALQPAGEAASGVLTAPTGHLAFGAAAGPPVQLRAGRFAPGAAVPIGTLPGGGKAELDLPTVTGSFVSWRVAIQAHQRVVACSR
jgi:hypothetical protein